MAIDVTRPTNTQNAAARTEQVNRQSRTRRQEDIERQQREQKIQSQIKEVQIKKEQTVEATIVRIRESQKSSTSGKYIDVKI